MTYYVNNESMKYLESLPMFNDELTKAMRKNSKAKKTVVIQHKDNDIEYAVKIFTREVKAFGELDEVKNKMNPFPECVPDSEDDFYLVQKGNNKDLALCKYSEEYQCFYDYQDAMRALKNSNDYYSPDTLYDVSESTRKSIIEDSTFAYRYTENVTFRRIDNV